ncbi:MAG: hypothetical protein GY731_12200 [Gammaproteobacteria bacterium]|nr:hypothetical protein [Gammaproteobacteria bacterium]
MRRLLLTLLLFSSATFAEEELPWYTVEMIVLQHLDPEALDKEQWSDDPGFPNLENAVELGIPSPLLDEEMAGEPLAIAAKPHAFMLLDREQHELGEVRKLLKRSRPYRPLLHLAWRQPGFSRKESRAVHIRSKIYHRGGRGNAVANKPTSAPYAPLGNMDVNASGDTPLNPIPITLPLDGTVRLYRSRYLHVLADLRFYRPAQRRTLRSETGLEAESMEEVQPTVFRLQESRRMRSKELHYLDHPILGLLIKVTPFELPQADELLSPVPTEEKPVPVSATPPLPPETQ